MARVSGAAGVSAAFLVALVFVRPVLSLEANASDGLASSSAADAEDALDQFRDTDPFISSAAAVFSRLSEMGGPSGGDRPGPLSLLRTKRASGVSKRLLFQAGGSVRSMPVFKLSLTDRNSRKSTIDALADHITDLLTEQGVTPMVVSVANDTVGLVRDTVMPMIFHEHEADEALLVQAYVPFINLDAELAEKTEEIYNLSLAVLSRGASHISCRNRESAACVLHTDCERELLELEHIVEEIETTLIQTDTEIEEPWCDETVVRTTTTFRTLSASKFYRYIQAVTDLEIAQGNYDAKAAECQELSTWQDRNRTVCDDVQRVLEETACNQGFHVSFGSADYYQRFEFAANAFDALKDQVRVTEADRKVEYTTLMQVMCLLAQLTNPEHGSASSEETAREIASCHLMVVDTSPLDLVYRETPEPGVFPELPEVPCTDAFLAHEYGDLPTCTEAAPCGGCPSIASATPGAHGEAGGAFAHCCTEMAAECYACQSGQTVEQFCSAHRAAANHAFNGCPDPTTTTAAPALPAAQRESDASAPVLAVTHPLPHLPHMHSFHHHHHHFR